VLVAPGDGTFAAAVVQAAGGREVDVILDLVGGSYLAEDLRCVAVQGRIVLVGLLAGNRVDLDLAMVLRKRLRIAGTMLRSRPLEEKIAATRVFARHVVPLLARGLLRPVVDRVLPLSAAAEAHAYVASNAGFGKVVLEP
jgi:NADPH:quinone reductase-like Zn-dependent oxidoreductase